MNKHKRKAAALDYVYATYQVDRDELEAIATLKAIDPETDIVALCDVFTDIAREQQEEQAAQDAEPMCDECAAIEALINAVMQAIDQGTSRTTIKQIIASALQ